VRGHVADDLIGMRERVRLYGGALETVDGGVRATLPLDLSLVA
jgi:hypothetical protein